MSFLEKLVEKKYMVRFASWPGGNKSLAVYQNEKQEKQFLYEAKSMEELELKVKKDFPILFGSSIPKISGMPRPPGF